MLKLHSKNYANRELNMRKTAQRKGWIRRRSLADAKTRAARQHRRNAATFIKFEISQYS